MASSGHTGTGNIVVTGGGKLVWPTPSRTLVLWWVAPLLHKRTRRSEGYILLDSTLHSNRKLHPRR